jgi:hypothetical protein
MMTFFRNRSTSLSMVVLVQAIILLLQGEISYGTAFGRLTAFLGIPDVEHGARPVAWLTIRGVTLLVVVALWIVNRKQALLKAIIVLDGLLTFGLLMNLVALTDVLFGLTAKAVTTLLLDVVLMAASSVLIFSIWYWIIDPPDVEETQRQDAAWDFLFPQRGRHAAGLRMLAAALFRLPVPGLHVQFRVQPDRYVIVRRLVSKCRTVDLGGIAP